MTKIEIVKIHEDFIREIEDYGFDSLMISRIFLKTVESGKTLKITTNNLMRLQQLKNSIIAAMRRKGLNVQTWIKHYSLYIEHNGLLEKEENK